MEADGPHPSDGGLFMMPSDGGLLMMPSDGGLLMMPSDGGLSMMPSDGGLRWMTVYAVEITVLLKNDLLDAQSSGGWTT